VKIDKAGVKKILFITLSNIGDLVLTLPVLGVLKREFPKASIVVLAGSKAGEILRADTSVSDILVYNKRATLFDKLKLALKLKGMGFDMAVDMRHSLFPVLAGARYKTPIFKSPDRKDHRKEKHLKILSAMGISIENAPFPVLFNHNDRLRVNSILKEKGISPEDRIVAIAPGAKSRMKRWKIGGFTDVCVHLSREADVKVVLVGDETDKAINSWIIANGAGKAYDLSGCFNLRELAYFLSLSKLLITNDSAPLHIAGSVGIPVIAIFGPTDHKKYGPISPGSIVLRKGIACSPCEKAICEFDLECMKQISSEDVLNAAERIL
jgi:ADP-heptose:LPS heptosyltransferase